MEVFKSSIQLSDHFTYRKLLRFTMPTVLMMLFASFYVIVDGLFVSNCIGKDAFAAVNLIWPFPMIIGALGYMFGSGGCALVSKTLGEGDAKRARGLFSMFCLSALSYSVLFSAVGLFFIEEVTRFLGATEGQMMNDCITYGHLIMFSMPFFVLQTMLQPFMIAAERPAKGLAITFVAGMVNIILDAIFIGLLNMKVAGAGLATLLSQITGALLPLAYFSLRKPSNLYLIWPIFDLKAFWKACTNGLSEFVVNASMPIVNLLYVFALWRIGGEDAVGAYGVIMYVNVIFFSVYTGFSMGSAPVISYNYGAQRMSEVQNVKRRVLKILLVSAIIVTSTAELLAPLVSWGFAGGDIEFRDMIYEAFALYALSFAIAPFNIYASSFFTALNNGKVSAVISVSRILLFQIGAMSLLPLWFDIHGFWVALPVAELLCLFVTIWFYRANKTRYNY